MNVKEKNAIITNIANAAIADNNNFSTIGAAALGVNFNIAKASPTFLFLIKSITTLTFLEEIRA